MLEVGLRRARPTLRQLASARRSQITPEGYRKAKGVSWEARPSRTMMTQLCWRLVETLSRMLDTTSAKQFQRSRQSDSSGNRFF